MLQRTLRGVGQSEQRRQIRDLYTPLIHRTGTPGSIEVKGHLLAPQALHTITYQAKLCLITADEDEGRVGNILVDEEKEKRDPFQG